MVLAVKLDQLVVIRLSTGSHRMVGAADRVIVLPSMVPMTEEAHVSSQGQLPAEDMGKTPFLLKVGQELWLKELVPHLAGQRVQPAAEVAEVAAEGAR